MKNKYSKFALVTGVQLVLASACLKLIAKLSDIRQKRLKKKEK